MGIFVFFFLFLLFGLIFVISIAGSLLSGLFRLFGLSSGEGRKAYSDSGSGYEGYSEERDRTSRRTKSEEGARRMKKFKKVAEDVEFEEV